MIIVPREQMPQIEKDEVPRLLVYLGGLGVKIDAGYLDMDSLITHQDVNWDYARAIAKNPATMSSPILVTSDRAVIDGNHRYAALSAPFSEALELLRTFPAAYETAPITS